MTEEKTAEFKTEGDPAFPVEEKGTEDPSESPTENTDTDQTLSPEEDKEEAETKNDGEDNLADPPLVDHPRWKKREGDWHKRYSEQEKRHTDDIAKLREEFTPKSKEIKDDEVPSWFGGDKAQYNAYLADLKGHISESKDSTLKDIQTKSDEDQERIDDATKYFQEQVVEIQDDSELNPDSKKLTENDRNKLMKFVLDNKIVDTEGKWNYRIGYMLMKANVKKTKSDVLNEKKKIASATTSENRAEDKPSDVMTSEDFKNPQKRPW